MAPEKGGCISFFSFAMINTMIKRELERKGFVYLLTDQNLSSREVRAELKQETWK